MQNKTKNNSPLITVAVAIYNTKNEFLEKCIDSIITQTFEDIEILLIGDKTCEENRNLMEDFSSKDSRICIINNNENLGLSAVRNIAFENAKGKYIAFVDSDDWLDENILKETYEKVAANNSPDMVIFTYNVVINGDVIKTDYIGPEEKLFTGDEIKRLQLQVLDPTYKNKDLQLPMFVTAWAKLYKMDFIKGNKEIRFPEKMRTGGEDFPFNYRIIGKAENILLLGKYGYYYRRHNDSITAKLCGNTWKKRCQWMDEVKKVVEVQSKIDNKLYRRFCLNQALGQMIAICAVDDKELNAGNLLKEIRKNEHIKIALGNVFFLEYKFSKYIFYLLFKFNMMKSVMFILKHVYCK